MYTQIRMDFLVTIFDNACSFSYERLTNSQIDILNSRDAIVAHGQINLVNDMHYNVDVYAWFDPCWIEDEEITEPVIMELKLFVESILIPTDYRSRDALN